MSPTRALLPVHLILLNCNLRNVKIIDLNTIFPLASYSSVGPG
jgi:hypothetical protein